MGKTKKSETIFFGFEDIITGFLALKFGCAIINTMKSHQWPSFTHYMADGIPFLTYREVRLPGEPILTNIEFKKLKFNVIKLTDAESSWWKNLSIKKGILLKTNFHKKIFMRTIKSVKYLNIFVYHLKFKSKCFAEQKCLMIANILSTI